MNESSWVRTSQLADVKNAAKAENRGFNPQWGFIEKDSKERTSAVTARPTIAKEPKVDEPVEMGRK